MADWRRVHLGMFTVALDAAGKADDPSIPCLVVAGFVAPADAWIEFEPEWKKLIGPLGIWDTARMAKSRRDVLRTLIEMIPRFGVRKFSCGIDLADLKNVPNDIRQNFLLHAYPLCGRTLATYVDLWAMHERPAPIPRETVAFIFEEGESQQEKDALVHLMLEDGYPRPQFKYKMDCVIHDRPHKGFTPLQAADLLAWLVYQTMKEWTLTPQSQRTKDAADRISRLPFSELENLPELPRKITQQDLESYIESRTYVDLRRRMLIAQGDAPFNIETL